MTRGDSRRKGIRCRLYRYIVEPPVTTVEVTPMSHIGRPPLRQTLSATGGLFGPHDRIYIGKMGLIRTHGLASLATRIPFKRAKSLTNPHRRRLVQNIGGARSGQSAMTDDIIGVSGAIRNTYKLVRFLYSAVHTYIHVLQQ